MDTSVGSAIEAARNRLRQMQRDELNVLDSELLAGVVDDVDTLTLRYGNAGVAKGQYLGIGTEVLFVLAVDSATITVLRGARGTDADAHDEGAVVEVKPRFARGLIKQALLEEIRAWPPRLFAVGSATLTTSQGTLTYTTGLVFPTEIVDVLRIYDGGVTGNTDLRQRKIGFRGIRKGPATVDDGKYVVALDWTPPDSRVLHYEYGYPFVTETFDTDTDLVEDVGLSPSMFDLAWLGASKRMFTEIPRTDIQNQDEPRRAEEVPGGLITAVRRDIENEYNDRWAAETFAILHAYPPA